MRTAKKSNFSAYIMMSVLYIGDIQSLWLLTELGIMIMRIWTFALGDSSPVGTASRAQTWL